MLLKDNFKCLLNFKLTCLNLLVSLLHRIYVVHDEVKDKNFELELSWIGEGMSILVDLAQVPPIQLQDWTEHVV